MNYKSKLLDIRWQQKRLTMFERSGWTCQSCFEPNKTLHLHHKQYLRGREPWEYDSDQLVVLCENCHELQHRNQDMLADMMSRIPIDGHGSISRSDFFHLISGAIGRGSGVGTDWELAAQQVGEELFDIILNRSIQLRNAKETA